ncbi:hypothetical protein AB7M49_002646 [Bradyrhizobium elkanii]
MSVLRLFGCRPGQALTPELHPLTVWRSSSPRNIPPLPLDGNWQKMGNYDGPLSHGGARLKFQAVRSNAHRKTRSESTGGNPDRGQ